VASLPVYVSPPESLALLFFCSKVSRVRQIHGRRCCIVSVLSNLNLVKICSSWLGVSSNAGSTPCTLCHHDATGDSMLFLNRSKILQSRLYIAVGGYLYHGRPIESFDNTLKPLFEYLSVAYLRPCVQQRISMINLALPTDLLYSSTSRIARGQYNSYQTLVPMTS